MQENYWPLPRCRVGLSQPMWRLARVRTTSVLSRRTSRGIRSAASASYALNVTVDTSADLGRPGADITDTTINNAEKTAVGFTVAGLDGDATGVVTFSDGTNSVTVDVAANGNYSADLSALADGPISSVLNVTDDAGNTASANGATIDLDTSAGPGRRPGADHQRHHHQQRREDGGRLHGGRPRWRCHRRGHLQRRHQLGRRSTSRPTATTAPTCRRSPTVRSARSSTSPTMPATRPRRTARRSTSTPAPTWVAPWR